MVLAQKKDKNLQFENFDRLPRHLPRPCLFDSRALLSLLVGQGYLGLGTDVEKDRISSSTPNDKSFTWKVPILEETPDYFIRVCKGDDCDDTSEFTIKPLASVARKLSSVRQGAIQTFTWPAKPHGKNVEIHLYDEDPWLQFWNSDDKINTITGSTSNDGSFSWTVPGNVPPADNYYAKLCIDGTSYCVTSSTFTVSEMSGSLKVTAPGSGAQLHQQGQTTVAWQQTGAAVGKKVNLFVAPQSALGWLDSAGQHHARSHVHHTTLTCTTLRTWNGSIGGCCRGVGR